MTIIIMSVEKDITVQTLNHEMNLCCKVRLRNDFYSQCMDFYHGTEQQQDS